MRGALGAFLFLTLLVGAVPKPVQAATTTFTTGSDWESGTKTSVDTSVHEGDVYLQAEGSFGARNWKTPDLTISVGSSFASDGTNIYVTRGLADSLFWKYSPATDAWTELAPMPRGTYYGADLEYLDGHVYAIFGGYQSAFARYSVASNSWEVLSELAELTERGASLTTDGTDIYALRGSNSQEFFKYTVATGSWSLLAATPATIGLGADLVYDDGYLYTPRGVNTTTMYRYDIDANSWSTMAALPASVNDDMDITTDGTKIYVPRQNNTTTFYAYDIAGNSWSTLTAMPLASRYAGVVYNSSDEYVYVFRGNGTQTVWKYDPAANSYIGPSDAPLTLSNGSDILHYDGELYVARGASTTTMYNYDIDTNAWSTLAVAPAALADDTRGVVAGSYIYFFRGSNTTTFYRYNPSGNSWSTMTAAPAAVRFGGSLSYPGSGDYIYATRGATTLSFWRYSISQDSWDAGAVSDLPEDAEASYGSAMVSDGTDIYYFPGIGIKRFFKYDISENSWDELSLPPFSPYYGTDMAYDSGTIVAMAGWYKNDMWEYSIADDSWRKLQDMSGYRAQNIGPYRGASIESVGNGAFYISRGNATADIITYQAGDDNFPGSGVWTSPSRDLSYVSSWGNFSSSVTAPDDSSVTFQTRTSADGTTWSDWVGVSGSTISSPVNKYIQVRATLIASTGGAQTPVLHSISIEYAADSSAPTNPTTFVGKPQEVSEESLVSGEAYTHVNPYFSWSGHEDGQTAIDGFFVYFGTNESADPASVGEYQIGTSYVATEPFSTGTYYLRLKTKDTAGNVSEATTGFTYIYNGISPAQSLSVAESADFVGTASLVATTGDAIKLQSKSNGFWMEETLSTTPATMQYGAKNIAYTEDTEKLYAFRGNNSTTFYEYDIESDTWSSLAAAPANVRMGGGVVEGPDGFLYGLRGNNTTSFWIYNIEENTWSDEDAADAPLTINYGGSIIYDGDQYVYALRGNNDDAFWRYDTTVDEWESLAAIDFGAPSNAVNNSANHGADLAIDIENELIYGIQGNLRDGFSVYDINTNAWTVLDDLPQLPYMGASLEFSSTTGEVFFIPGYFSDKMFKYDVTESTWSEVSSAPTTFYYGATLKNVGDSLYVIRGNNSNGFYRYDIPKDSWLSPNRGLFGTEYQGVSYLGADYGADIVKGDGDHYYITRGNYADDFIRWDAASGTSARMKNAPVGTYLGSTLVYDSTEEAIYLTGGIYLRKFFKYDIGTNTWTEEASDPPPNNINYGASMVHDGARYIYLSAGGATTTFYQFDTQADAGEKWSTLAALPATIGYGSELLLREGYIYALRGNNVANNPFYRYDIEANTWSDPAVADMSIDVNYGGFLADGGDGNFYAARGENDTNFYSYSVADNDWTTLDATPARIGRGGSGESNGSNKIHMLSGAGTGSYADAVYTYVMQTENSGFETSGTYTTPSHDLTAVYKWASLVVDYTAASNTSLIIQTRSSEDGETWSSWTNVAQEKQVGSEYTYQIKSPANRYIEASFALTSSDGVSSGVINSYTINYYKDTSAPTNPTNAGLSVYSDDGPGDVIVSNTWYNHSEPHFDWPEAEATNGASDTASGSGVAGYYVYFGTEAEADPAVDGEMQSTTDYTASELVDGTTYYLRIKTVDNAENISADVWAPFIYKYDGGGPSAPTAVTADPAGYTSVNSFDFDWQASTADGATVSSYCYKTGASSGDYSVDQCIEATEITGIPSYKVGANTFSVRAKDTAGNYSEYVTVQYYFVDSDNAPAPPRDVTVTPSTNTTNSFAFAWSAPANGTFYGSVSNLSYLYSINALPTAQSTTSTSLKSLIAGAYATLPGDNTFYIVTKDEAGNVNYSNYASATFSANTSAPGIPLNIDIADVSVKATSSWKLAISWEEPTIGTVASYAIYRSTDGANYTLRASSGGISYVDVGLAQETYYYKVKACDSTNNCGEFSDVVSFLPDGKFVTPAGIISDPVASAITTKKATISWTTDRTSDSRISYGLSSGSYFDEEVSSSEHVAAHSLNLLNLSPGTQYYYVTKWTDEDGNTGVSAEQTFTTEPPPTTEEPTASSVGLDQAIIQFVSKNASRVRIFYGESSAFGGVEDVVVGTGEGTHTVQLEGLTDGTKYFFKINSFDSEGEEYEGEIHSFTTLPRPKIENITVNQVRGTAKSTLLVTWESNTEISSIATYYPLSAPSLARDAVNVALKSGKHKMILSELNPQTTYVILIKGKDIAGNEAIGEPQQVTTASDTRPPVISDLKVDGEIIGTGDEATAQLLISYKTDEPATAQIEFGEGTGSTYSQKTQEDGALTNNHLVVISELSPAKVYHLRAISKDEAGNVAESIDKVVITPKATENALDLVIASMSQIFGFLR